MYILLKQKRVFLEITPPSFSEKTPYSTQQLFSVIYNIGSQKSLIEKILGKKSSFSFEIVSTRTEGIRYILSTTPEQSRIVEHTLLSSIPQIRIKQVEDYLPEKFSLSHIKTVAFKLRKHFAFPLAKQANLKEHDPAAFITGMMTKLKPNELIVFQVIISPTKTNETNILTRKILHNEHVLDYLNSFHFPSAIKPIIALLKFIIEVIDIVLLEIGLIITEIFHGSSSQQNYAFQAEQTYNLQNKSHLRPARVLSTFEQQVVLSVQEKVNQSLFETTIRAFVSMNEMKDQVERIKSIKASLGPFSVPGYQSFKPVTNYPLVTDILRIFAFRNRLLSLFSNKSSTILSVSEIADLYHFPFSSTTKTEDIVKVYSPELPAPLALKNTVFDVTFAKNTYANSYTLIGLTDEDRSRHVYMLGQTGSGKTTIIFHMAKDDIQKGRGLAVIDPHGDLAEDLLETIPYERKNDLIYLNPFDLKFPIGINLLELTKGLDDDSLELEKELVTESVISIFRRVFSNDEKSNAHRIEYILRNTIYTSFTIPDRTIFTIYDLLNNPGFQRKVTKNITDENLQNFWKYEIGRAGNYQVVKMVSGVTAKVGRFLFSPTAKRILEQQKSTINFDEILDTGKILICNLAEGKLGEDTSQLLGTMVLAKIQQAAFRRSQMNGKIRKPFYLYIDEFQTFATSSFTKILSGGRKFGLRITIAEQSTSQQEDKNVTYTILANTGTVICFRTASPIDEDIMLSQFRPNVLKGAISDLPRYHFYIKLAASEPQGTFSAETLPLIIKRDQEKLNTLIASSRKNWAIVYKKLVVNKDTQQVKKNQQITKAGKDLLDLK